MHPESVAERPPPGLARGLFAAPAWVFWVVLGVTLLGLALWTLRTLRARRGRP